MSYFTRGLEYKSKLILPEDISDGMDFRFVIRRQNNIR